SPRAPGATASIPGARGLCPGHPTREPARHALRPAQARAPAASGGRLFRRGLGRVRLRRRRFRGLRRFALGFLGLLGRLGLRLVLIVVDLGLLGPLRLVLVVAVGLGVLLLGLLLFVLVAAAGLDVDLAVLDLDAPELVDHRPGVGVLDVLHDVLA